MAHKCKLCSRNIGLDGKMESVTGICRLCHIEGSIASLQREFGQLKKNPPAHK